MSKGREGTFDRSYTLTPAGVGTLDEVRAARVHPRTNILIGVPAEDLPITVQATAVQIVDRGEHGGVQMVCTVQMCGEPEPVSVAVHLPDETRTLIAQVLGGIRPSATAKRGADS